MKKIVVFSLISFFCLHGMDQTKLCVYGVPSTEGEDVTEYVKKVIRPDVDVVSIKNPDTIDLGQWQCMQSLDKELKKKSKAGIIYAFSQGTATTLNYITTYNPKNIGALILEGSLLSGNNVIYQSIIRKKTFLGKMPLLYYWLPYVAKLAYLRRYRPAGLQPIKSVVNVSIDMPIILVHAKQDDLTPYSDACALYYVLRSKGNKNVYLVSKDSKEHRLLMQSDNEQRKAVRGILDKHGLIQTKLPNIDLSKYQPDPKQFKKHYDALIKKEKQHVYLERSLLATGVACLAAVVKYFMS